MSRFKNKVESSNMRKELMKITSVSFGAGGYQDVQFGLSLNFESKGGSCCGDFISGGWDYSHITPDKSSKWTEKDRTESMAKMCKTISEILHSAKVRDVSELKGKPVEVIFESMMLTSWRILEEVL